MAVRISLNILGAFDIVYGNFSDENYHLYYSLGNHKYLMNMYDLTIGGVEVIAYLLHFYPTEIVGSKLRTFPNKRNESSDSVLEDLKRRGFIEERQRPSLSESSFVIKEEAYAAFQNGEKYGRPFFKDCIQELSACALNDIYNPDWLDKFLYSLGKPGNEQIKEACDALGVLSLEQKLQRAFWVLARHFLLHFSDPLSKKDVEKKEEELDSIFCGSDVEECGLEDLFEDIGNLAKYGLADVITVEVDSRVNSEYALSAHSAGILFHGRDDLIKYNELAKYAIIIKCQNIKKKDLYFSDEAQEQIDNLRTVLSEEGFRRAMGILKAQNRAQSIQSLLFGPPGTGKTESVLQLALESGRDVIKYDASKVTGWGWGTTEKSYRALFRAYKYVAVIAKKTPILLLNEADATLSKRLAVERSIDKAENAVTNILLEEMESLIGILLATTNLIDNLDEAFDRRFLFKTELITPDVAARTKIWKTYIPQLKDAEARYLAEKYEMSGAQINNVATKRDLAELYFFGERDVKFIEGLCEKELSTEKSSRSKCLRIGF